MRKLLFIMIMLFLLIYILLYKVVFVFYGDIMKYIINPLVWLSFAMISYSCLYRKSIKSSKNNNDIIYIVIASSLIYLIIFYTLGLFTGYSKNPYSSTVSGIIINIFSILFVIGIKEYIRNILINKAKKYSVLYYGLIFVIFVISDINILVVFKSFTDVTSVFNSIGGSVVPIISINIFMIYLCTKGGYVPAMLYRVILFLPTLIIPIIPRYEWIIPTLFDVLFPLFTYLVIQYTIHKRDKMVSDKTIEELNPRRWILTFVVTIIIIMFGLGTFGVKPVVVITASMQPLINPGDIVIIDSSSVASIKVGDIIQYKIKDYNVVHRVVKILDDSNGISLILKGDNNLNVDRDPVKEDQLVGKIIYHVPYIGYPSYLIQKMIKGKEVEIETGK